MGIRSPIGNTLKEFVKSLKERRSGISIMPEWEGIKNLRTRVAGLCDIEGDARDGGADARFGLDGGPVGPRPGDGEDVLAGRQRAARAVEPVPADLEGPCAARAELHGADHAAVRVRDDDGGLGQPAAANLASRSARTSSAWRSSCPDPS